MADIAQTEVRFAAAAPDAALTRVSRSRISLEVVGFILQAVDFVLAVIAAQLAYLAYNFLVLHETNLKFETPSLVGAVVFLLVLRRFQVYAPKRLVDLKWQMRNVGYAWLVTLALLAFLVFAAKITDSYSRGWAFLWAFATPALLGGARLGVAQLVRKWRREGRLFQRVALVGAGPIGERFVEKWVAAAEPDVVIVGIYDDRNTRRVDRICGHPIIGNTDDLVAHVREMSIDQIVIALPLPSTERLRQLIAKFRSLPVDLRISVDPIASQVPIQNIGSIADSKTIEVFDRPLKHQSGFIKWTEDYVLATLLLVLLAPLMLVIALAIWIESPGPVLFVQERFGFNNKVFRVYKFRTMRLDGHDPSGVQRTVRNDPRVTRVGRILRHLSLDELPQLVNVLRGEMSLVGPRPHVVAMRAGDKLYHEAVGDYFLRHRVKPGITGWAQVHGLRGEISNALDAQQRVVYDLYYIDNWSLFLDLKILAMTAGVVVLTKNAY